MSYQSLDFDVQDGIAWITINRPKSYNAIDLSDFSISRERKISKLIAMIATSFACSS